MGNKLSSKAGQKADEPELYDCFLSHNWGHDMSNHTKVARINRSLQAREINTLFDDDKLLGDTRSRATVGVDAAKLTIVCITEIYRDKVNGKDLRDNIKYEFMQACVRHGTKCMIPVVLERSMRGQATWGGELGAALASVEMIDLCDEATYDAGIDQLVLRIDGLLCKPVVIIECPNKDVLAPEDMGEKIRKYAKEGSFMDLERVTKQWRGNVVVDEQDWTGCTALNLAVINGHTTCVELLVNAGADVNIADRHNTTPCYCAAYKGRDRAMDVLIKSGKCSVDLCDDTGSSPLLEAANRGHTACVDLLIKANANVNKADDRGNTPLACARNCGHEAIVEMLLSKGAK